MENQIAALRARLEVFEARQVPYTAEELALFQRPEINLTEATVKSAKKSVKELPPGSAALVVQAQRDFAAHDMTKPKPISPGPSSDDKNGAILAEPRRHPTRNESPRRSREHINRLRNLRYRGLKLVGVFGSADRGCF